MTCHWRIVVGRDLNVSLVLSWENCWCCGAFCEVFYPLNKLKDVLWKRRFMNSPFTTKWPNACACPKTFAAEHLYTPASLPCTFCKLRIPPVTADCLICNLFGSLLHNTAGWGLPVTEHWNVADPLSFTVTLEGERATEGAENDSPGSPFGPGMPVGPVSPFWPLIPSSPGSPTGPLMPCLPLFPGNPIMPWSPLFPGLPLCPLRPRSPFSPLGPGGPGGPGNEHVTPLEWQSCSLPSDKSFLIFHTVWSTEFVLFELVESAWRLYSLFLWCMGNWSSKKEKKINKTVHCYKVRMIPINNNSRSAAVKFYSEFINRLRIIYIFFIWWKYVIYSLSCVSLGAALTLCLIENQQGPLDYLQIRWFMLPRIPRLLSQFMRRTLAPVADGDWFGPVVYQSLIQSLHRRSKLSREGAKRIQSNLNNTDSSLLWAVIFALNLKIDTISIEFLPL